MSTNPLSSLSSSSSASSSASSSSSSFASSSTYVETEKRKPTWRDAEQLADGMIRLAMSGDFWSFEACGLLTAERNYTLFEQTVICINEQEEDIPTPLFDRMQQCFQRITNHHLHPKPYLYNLTTFRTDLPPLTLQDTNFIPKPTTGIFFVAEEVVAKAIEFSKETLLENRAKSLSDGDSENPVPAAKEIIKNEIINGLCAKIPMTARRLQKLDETRIGDVIEEQLESFFTQEAGNSMERVETHSPAHEDLLTTIPTEPAPDEDLPTPIATKITRTVGPYVGLPDGEILLKKESEEIR